MAKPTNSSTGSRAATGDRLGGARASDQARTAGPRLSAGGTTVRSSGGTPPRVAGIRDVTGVRTPAGAHATTAADRPWQGRDAPTGALAHLPGLPPPRPPWNGALAASAPSTGRGRPLAPSTRRMYARRRRSMLLVFLLVAGIILFVGQALRDDDPAASVTVPPAVPTTVAPAASAEPTATKPTATKPTKPPTSAVTATTGAAGPVGPTGPGTALGTSRITATDVVSAFAYASTPGPVLGTTGGVRRFKVAVENGADLSAREFADQVDRILGDPRSWIAGRQFRFQRVTQASASEFTVFLATAATSERMCAAGGLQTAKYTSCRLGGQVIINLDRWQGAVPDYGAPLGTYQAYALNHEVGHQLGYGHEACPGDGTKAPVMQQQTYGLKGCTANAWPYIDGERYAGHPIA